ncbi:prefoldin subunit 1 [Tothia fuscella]|uniref:Prefoldin subunit 1 n=1 Tax=Tothia fuscella TaxID=1048955 RepID=A0A9P4TZ49_9PEZI|nr:prefoldin subunit 1 [Tothia fuscella]
MSISNDALRKVLEEIDQKSQFSSQQITIVKAQLSAKAREQRMLQLTASEVGALPPDTHIYEGVGKMFVMTPSDEVVARLGKETKELENDKSNLDKKLHYLETTYKNSKDSFENILKRAGGG